MRFSGSRNIRTKFGGPLVILFFPILTFNVVYALLPFCNHVLSYMQSQTKPCTCFKMTLKLMAQLTSPLGRSCQSRVMCIIHLIFTSDRRSLITPRTTGVIGGHAFIFFHVSFRGGEEGWEEEKCNDILGRHHFWQHHLQVHALHPCCLHTKNTSNFSYWLVQLQVEMLSFVIRRWLQRLKRRNRFGEGGKLDEFLD